MKYNNKYSNIINLPHHVSSKHSHMSNLARSAQFAPFAALEGYYDGIKETARYTNKKIEIDEETKIILDRKLEVIINKINLRKEITFVYFIPDSKKEGGVYVKKSGVVKRLDSYNKEIVLENNSKISILDIIQIEGDIFKDGI